eukprot:scaffold71971_cov55-Attheya_sp.AAC.1
MEKNPHQPERSMATTVPIRALQQQQQQQPLCHKQCQPHDKGQGRPQETRLNQDAKTKKGSEIFYNIQGSGKNKKESIGPYKFEYIISLMKEKGIDIYLVQETWLPNDFERDTEGHYIFHHGTPEASDSNTGGEATGANTPKWGQTRGGVAIILSPRATAAWKKAGQPEPTRSGVILGCARFIALHQGP